MATLLRTSRLPWSVSLCEWRLSPPNPLQLSLLSYEAVDDNHADWLHIPVSMMSFLYNCQSVAKARHL